jgi:hypothetical protein
MPLLYRWNITRDGLSVQQQPALHLLIVWRLHRHEPGMDPGTNPSIKAKGAAFQPNLIGYDLQCLGGYLIQGGGPW